MSRDSIASPAAAGASLQPFRDAEEAWFWFVQCRSAQLDGARVTAGKGDTPRPCEPLDILAVVDRLYRRRRLLREHLTVLADYGRQLMPPDPDAPRQMRAARLWEEALAELASPLRDKGIVE
ncbi:hypothetical protein DRB17_15155 [Ferruginivarius sediminum]|uniref:Uncharacterized protein n=1 Tax=Ferruginivarius sediminum TaxID=2661937 RepID=A0A369T9L9_9PROT|nr:hypothetical protein DRB17_15155 [Ferruginivarius sediminum]